MFFYTPPMCCMLCREAHHPRVLTKCLTRPLCLPRSRSLDGAKERPAVCVTTSQTPILDVIAQLAASGLHRVFILDGDRKPTGVVSLKDILRTLFLLSSD